MTLELKPKRGGFLRAFGCGEFIRDFLLGKGPFGSTKVDPKEGAPQAVAMLHEVARLAEQIGYEDLHSTAEQELARWEPTAGNTKKRRARGDHA